MILAELCSGTFITLKGACGKTMMNDNSSKIGHDHVSKILSKIL